ncbi:hypothetical protein [Streptosporangium sp. NPDC087985]|uniref:hypothetical protein n=1 Tax=Streptosporangium sp. NPDC087985 TaxID=3366196 RepID=UPI003818AD40
MSQPGVAQLMEGVAGTGRIDVLGGLLEQVLGTLIGQAGASGERAQVDGRRSAGRAGPPVGEEDRPAGAAGEQAELLTALPDLQGTGWTLHDLAGLDAALAGDILNEPAGGNAEELPEPGDAEESERATVWGVVVTCENEVQQAELLERLADEGWNVRALM